MAWGRSHKLAMAILLLLATTGCAGGDDDGDDDGNGSTESDTAESPDGNGSGEGGDGGIEYVPWGPNDPPIPGQYAALATSSGSALDCDGVASQAPAGEFWSTVVAVCRAITGQGDWPSTISVPSPPPAANAYQQCLDEELSAMLRSAFAWHEAHPGAQPSVSYPSASALSPCQTQIYDAAVFPAEGGIDVELSVPGLNDGNPNPQVLINGVPVEVRNDFGGAGDGLSNGSVFLAAPFDAGTATLEITTDFGTLSTTIELPRADESPESQTTETDDSAPEEETTSSNTVSEAPSTVTTP
jgi:hypothetical protein